ncbi:MAG: M23 family metallopeptidase [Undibacterium sp.]|nr:M23 family metallopeptidase [Undibacterium sp.]
MMKFLALLLIVLLAACGGGSSSGSNISQSAGSNVPAIPLPSGPLIYIVAPAAGKLPWPQHNPSFTQDQYAAMVKSNFILNNFGLLQGNEDGSGSRGMYLHDGLDFMLPDGTSVYAVKAGTIKDLMPSGGIITVEDLMQLGTGWQMAHLDVDVRLQVGQKLQQGQFVGVIRNGEGHTHFNRILNLQNTDWSYGNVSLYPDDLFDLPDTLAPVIFPVLYYFKDASDTVFLRTNNLVTLSGKVDIVAGLRDLAGNPQAATPERKAPSKFDLLIKDEVGKTVWHTQADLRNIAITPPFLGDASAADREVKLLYKKPIVVDIAPWRNQGFSWWVMTNLPTYTSLTRIDVKDEDLHWDTSAKNANGQAIYSNSLYTVVLSVADSNGNQTTMTDAVLVKN